MYIIYSVQRQRTREFNKSNKNKEHPSKEGLSLIFSTRKRTREFNKSSKNKEHPSKEGLSLTILLDTLGSSAQQIGHNQTTGLGLIKQTFIIPVFVNYRYIFLDIFRQEV